METIDKTTLLSIVNNAAINMGVQVSRDPAFSPCDGILGSGIDGSYGNTVVVF